MESGKTKKGFTRMRDSCARFGISPSQWWRFVKAGKAPPAIRLATRTTVWRTSDLDELEELFIAGKDWRDHTEKQKAA